jgi:hypothetical protein
MQQNNASRQGVKAGKEKACKCRHQRQGVSKTRRVKGKACQRQGVSRQASWQSVKAGKHAIQCIKKIQNFEQLFNLNEFFL